MVAVVRSASGTFTGTGFTVDLGAATSAANAVAVFVYGNTTVTTPAGFTLRQSQVNEAGHYLYDRAGGSQTYAFTNANGAGTWVALELAGAAYVTGTSSNAGAAGAPSYGSGSVTPTAGARAIYASIGSLIGNSTVRTITAWTNSFTELHDLCQASADYPMQGAATLEVTANGSTAYSTTATYSTSSSGRSAIIAAYSYSVSTPPPEGEAAVTYTWAVSATGKRNPAAGATLTHAWALSAEGHSPDLDSPEGAAAVTYGWAVAVTGRRDPEAAAVVGYGWSLAAVGDMPPGPVRSIVEENALEGTARATWDLSAGSWGGITTLQGFADGFSFNRDELCRFKIAQSDGAGWSADVYRLGWYGGDGARHYGTLTPDAGQLADSQSQPSPGDADAVTSKLSADCANWDVTLEWEVPDGCPSGMFLLVLNRTGGGKSHVLFVVRDDARAADLMVMPSDSTWQAYNAFGGMGSNLLTGNSLYFGTDVNQYSGDCARFVSYNRPIVNRAAANSGQSYGACMWSTFFTGEYPMVRFLERNGYDVKYYGCIDAMGDPDGALLDTVDAAMMIGHNEYWSTPMRSGWEAFKEAGGSIFSCASNEVFWRTVGSQPDSSGRPRRMECYKSTISGRGVGASGEWTGTWRDPDGAANGGDNPENLLTGTIFVVNGPDLRALRVPFAGGYSQSPVWRGTEVAALSTGTWDSPGQILGFEWDTYGPAGVSTGAAAFLADPHIDAHYASHAQYSISSGLLLTDAGDVYNAAGTAQHRLVVVPNLSTGKISTFGTGTINWALGVDSANTYHGVGSDNTSIPIRQATVNVLADMGALPASLMSGLTEPTPHNWSDIPVGTADVTYGWSVAATGERAPVASASVTYGWSLSASGERAPVATASASYIWALAAVGDRKPEASASMTLTWALSATGRRDPESAASIGYAWSVTTTGSRSPTAAAGISYGWDIAAAGNAPDVDVSEGYAAITYTWALAASGQRRPVASASLSYTWALAAAGDAPAVDIPEGEASIAYTWVLSANGHRAPASASAITYTWGAASVGYRAPVAAASITYGWVIGQGLGVVVVPPQNRVRVRAESRRVRVQR